VCKSIKPREVLEWGPGRSTGVILDNTDAKILTIEHQQDYYDKAQTEFGDNPNVEVVHRPLGIKPMQSLGYVNYPIYRLLKEGAELRKYDLIFVDGRSRFDCVIASRFMLREGGVVLLHDAHREIYLPAVESFPYCKVLEDYRTAIMSNDSLDCLEGFDG
jgi:predicted O-methyltransferase YrrM